MKEFDEIKVKFSDFAPDWTDIASEVLEFFSEKRKQDLEAAGEREQQTDQIWAEALAKHGIIASQLNLMPGSNSQAPFYSSKQKDNGRA